MKVGDHVHDKHFLRIYGPDGGAALGIVTRVYDAELVEVEWQTDYLRENCWTNELVPADTPATTPE